MLQRLGGAWTEERVTRFDTSLPAAEEVRAWQQRLRQADEAARKALDDAASSGRRAAAVEDGLQRLTGVLGEGRAKRTEEWVRSTAGRLARVAEAIGEADGRPADVVADPALVERAAAQLDAAQRHRDGIRLALNKACEDWASVTAATNLARLRDGLADSARHVEVERQRLREIGKLEEDQQDCQRALQRSIHDLGEGWGEEDVQRIPTDFGQLRQVRDFVGRIEAARNQVEDAAQQLDHVGKGRSAREKDLERLRLQLEAPDPITKADLELQARALRRLRLRLGERAAVESEQKAEERSRADAHAEDPGPIGKSASSAWTPIVVAAFALLLTAAGVWQLSAGDTLPGIVLLVAGVAGLALAFGLRSAGRNGLARDDGRTRHDRRLRDLDERIKTLRARADQLRAQAGAEARLLGLSEEAGARRSGGSAGALGGRRRIEAQTRRPGAAGRRSRARSGELAPLRGKPARRAPAGAAAGGEHRGRMGGVAVGTPAAVRDHARCGPRSSRSGSFDPGAPGRAGRAGAAVGCRPQGVGGVEQRSLDVVEGCRRAVGASRQRPGAGRSSPRTAAALGRGLAAGRTAVDRSSARSRTGRPSSPRQTRRSCAPATRQRKRLQPPCASVEADWRRGEPDRQAATERLLSVAAGSDRVQQQWNEWRAACGLDAPLSPEGVIDFFALVTEARRAVARRDTARNNLAALSAEIDEWQARVRETLVEAGLRCPEDEPQAWVEAARDLSNRCRTDAAARQEAVRLDDEIEATTRKHRRLSTVADERSKELAALLGEAGVSTEEEFRSRLAVYRCREELKAQIAGLEARILAALGRGDSAEAARRELGTGRVDQWAAERDRHAAEVQELGGQHEAAIREHENLVVARRQVEEACDVADLELRLQAVRGELEAAVHRRRVVRLSARLLRDTLGRVRAPPPAARCSPTPPAPSPTSPPGATRTSCRPKTTMVSGWSIPPAAATACRISVEGRRSSLYLCMRLGLAREFGERAVALPLVMDDVLVNFDEARARRMAAELLEFAEDNQVLLFTCHEFVRSLLLDLDPNLRVIDLPVHDIPIEGSRAAIAGASHLQPQ